ncbi:hypothetical protein GOP47_0008313 [Adiantum capillus-veneris]|uniref:Nodulin-like domain-containing protein n=1 Tax=Adiantum capillus-veneris TaxID=13818 RepID=A0A9D4UZ33_ADICA|nr:hypothetical protein GOP47_0008313 [Adiantum capillus-veneris]
MEKFSANESRRTPPSRLSALLRSPWMIIAVGVWVQCFTGGSYDFSIYSQRIKDSLKLTQQALDSISVSKDIGANVGIISGFIYDFCPTWVVLACAAALAFIGNLMMWLSITLRIPSPPLWLACVYALLTANSQTFSNTAVIVTSVKIFPTFRGTVVGLMKGCLGIGGAILVQVYLAAFGTSPQTFPLMMACLAPLICMVAMFFIRPIRPVVRAEEQKWLNVLSGIILSLSAYLLAVIVLESFVSLGRPWKITIFGGIIVILLCPFWVAVKAELTVDESNMIAEAGRDEYILLPEEAKADEEAHSSSDISNKVEELDRPKTGEDASLLQAMRSLDFWLLFVASACGMGSGLTVINNMSQLGSSLGYSTSEISTFVSLWSIWNFLGRFGAGHISELFLHSKGLPRPLFIVITLGAMALGHLVIAFAFSNALYIGPVLVGTCYGAQWSLMPTTASELFGLKHFGAIFNTIAIASPISSYILSVKVTGYFYDMEAEKEAKGWVSASSSCSGAHCFRLSFFIMAVLCSSEYTFESQVPSNRRPILCHARRKVVC